MAKLNQAAAARAQEMLEMPTELPSRPAGYSGTPIVGGRLGSDYEHLYEFSTPRLRARTISKMLRTSPILAIAEEYLAGQVTGVTLTVPRQGKSEEACDALERWLGIGAYADSGGRCGTGGVDEMLRHLCSARTYGHVAMSEAWVYDEDAGLYWCHLYRRRQESYDTYITEPGTERLIGITQRTGYVKGGIQSIVLPMNETLWLVHRPDLGWYDGRSVMRPCFPHWRSEQTLYALNDLAAAKYSDPPLRGSLDVDRFNAFSHGQDGAPANRTDYEDEIRSMQTALESLHSDENAHLLYPDWWSFEEVSKQHNYDPEPLLRSAEHHQRVMAERLYIAWITQGRKGDGGSRSMVDVQSSVIENATVDILQWVLQGLNSQTVRRFMRANFSTLDESEYPVVSFERASVIAPWWQSNANAFVSMVTSGVVTVNEEDERSIRAASDLPPPPEDSPTAEDRQANAVGGRLKTVAGQREAEAPARSRSKKNAFVDRLVDRDE